MLQLALPAAVRGGLAFPTELVSTITAFYIFFSQAFAESFGEPLAIGSRTPTESWVALDFRASPEVLEFVVYFGSSVLLAD